MALSLFGRKKNPEEKAEMSFIEHLEVLRGHLFRSALAIAAGAIVSSPVSPYDKASKAAMYNTLKKIRAMLATAVSTDEQTKAHRATLVFIIDKALSVK